MKMKTVYRLIAIGVAVAAIYSVATAGSMYSWSSGETLTASQLNANFNHIHNNMVGGHGARLVDADVASNAAISRSKLAAYQSLPLAWAKVGNGSTTCSSSPCTVADQYGVSGVTRSGAGIYVVTLSTAMSDSEYAVIVSSQTADVVCGGIAASTTLVSVVCRTVASSPAAADAVFSLSVYDT
jgi:hypothetical protein